MQEVQTDKQRQFFLCLCDSSHGQSWHHKLRLSTAEQEPKVWQFSTSLSSFAQSHDNNTYLNNMIRNENNINTTEAKLSDGQEDVQNDSEVQQYLWSFLLSAQWIKQGAPTSTT